MSPGGSRLFPPGGPSSSTATALADRWKKANVPVELHIFPDGGHGFGMNRKGKSCDAWTDLLAEWMKRQGLLPAS